MNVNRLYIVKIYVNFIDQIENDLTWYKEGRYIKQALVYHDDERDYIDLISGEHYKLGLVPINEVLDISFKKQDMTKKKILKSINKAMLLRKKEEDK